MLLASTMWFPDNKPVCGLSPWNEPLIVLSGMVGWFRIKEVFILTRGYFFMTGTVV